MLKNCSTLVLLALIACQLSLTDAFLFPEHTWELDKMQFKIDKEYLWRNYTHYTFELSELKPFNRMKMVALWRSKDSGELSGTTMTYKIPPNTTIEAESEPFIRSSVLKSVYQDELPAGIPNENILAKQMLLGQFNGKVLTNENDGSYYVFDEYSFTNTVNWTEPTEGDDDFSPKLTLEFTREEHERLGTVDLWVHWIFYDEIDGTYCNNNTQPGCLAFGQIQGPNYSFEYSNTLTFTDYYDRDTVMIFYGMMTFMSIFWVVGLQIELPIGYALWGYMLFMDINNLKAVFDWQSMERVQSDRLNLLWWLFESVLYWDLGTILNVNIMWTFSFIPGVGPILNLIWMLIVGLFVYG